ncbi:MAG: PAS domain S-box protein [Verrucomicrobia bacterium]|nr:PAS domain S-box protein [Verrucomicrobiota bacterium]
MPKGQSSIKHRVRAVILLVSIVVLLITATLFVAYEVISFRAQLVQNLSTLAAVIADNIAAPLAFNSEETAEEILSALKAEPDIVAASVFDREGNVFAKYPLQSQTHLLPAQLENAGLRFTADALVVFQPVIKEKKSIGTLYLRASLQGLYGRFWRYGAIGGAVLIGSLAVAFVLSTLLQKRISDPILALTSAAQKVSQAGDYSVRAPKLTEDELGTLTDAVNRMLAETQANQSRLAEQARLLNLTFDAILVRDAHNRITYWNRGAEELYGFTQEEALGKVSHELLRTEFPDSLEQIEEKLHRDNRWLGESVQTRKDGGKIHVASRWTLDRDAQGKQASTLEINTDITERKAFQAGLERLVAERTAKLQETVTELEAFSYSVSHDMRAPLRAMQGYAKALLKDYEDKLDSQAAHYLERISRASNRLDSLIQDVLAYSRVAKGEITLHPVDLERLIQDILPNHPEFQPPQACLLMEKPLHLVLGHEACLTQCVTNLLGNAVKFVPSGVVPQIRVRTELLDGRVRVWFEDNGIGIDTLHHDRIFEIFGQVHPEKKYGGTGIGLAIVRKAVQRMGGEVGVESEIGQGSRFWFILNEAKT